MCQCGCSEIALYSVRLWPKRGGVEAVCPLLHESESRIPRPFPGAQPKSDGGGGTLGAHFTAALEMQPSCSPGVMHTNKYGQNAAVPTTIPDACLEE